MLVRHVQPPATPPGCRLPNPPCVYSAGVGVVCGSKRWQELGVDVLHSRSGKHGRFPRSRIGRYVQGVPAACPLHAKALLSITRNRVLPPRNPPPRLQQLRKLPPVSGVHAPSHHLQHSIHSGGGDAVRGQGVEQPAEQGGGTRVTKQGAAGPHSQQGDIVSCSCPCQQAAAGDGTSSSSTSHP